MQLREGLFT